jgi:pyruvate formate lyase activating enzyme
MIMTSRPFVSGVVFSGGEPAMQKEALVTLARKAKQLGLAVCIQTNGYFPETLRELIDQGLADKIAIDYKTRWEGFSKRWEGFCNIPKENYLMNVRKSIELCKKARREEHLPEFEVVVTVFAGNEKDIMEISKEVGAVDFVIQQGEHKLGKPGTARPQRSNGEYVHRKRLLQEEFPPLSLDGLKKLADTLERAVRIRTRESGVVPYESNRRRRTSRKR